MSSDVRVCPHCGEPPGSGVFCAACGRNLSAVERLPTRAAWEAEHAGPAPSGLPVEERCGAATAAFLEAMRAAGNPGTERLQAPRRRLLGRTPGVTGWIVRPVDRDDDVRPRRYAPGLFLGVTGEFHQLDSELRGWGQRDFPQYHHTVGEEPVPMPADERLPGELAAVLRANGVEAEHVAGT
ncbi:MAG: hypothetical protein HZB46_08805 [Solirubrobacterales bacterium]|nr:hypothetical protein [Solirubrobacterales bacterium]